MRKAKILVIDDEEIACQSCQKILERVGHDVSITQNPHDALKRLKEDTYDLVVTDLMMPEIGGMDILRAVKEENSDTEVIMITGYGTVKSAVEAMRSGVYNYITKPFDPKKLSVMVEKALEKKNLNQSLCLPGNEVTPPFIFDDIIGRSPKMVEVFELIRKVATTNSTVLIIGESGTGKELVARAIHNNSNRRNMNFVAVDCTALSPTLLESELFGHIKGSFTGAITTRPGYFEIASGGTLFLDEVGNLSLDIQGKLLRVLQEREFSPVGGTKPKKVNIRLIAATNRDLEKMVSEGAFREDLFYRLFVVPIYLPPLRERKEDIQSLAMHFLDTYSRETGKKVPRISPEAMEFLTDFEWPGNVRQLENIVERMVIITEGDTINASELPQLLQNGKAGIKSVIPSNVKELKDLKKVIRKKSVENIERLFLTRALNRNEWNVTHAAKDVGMDRANFQAMMRRYNFRRSTHHLIRKV
ncbi:MAG: sigma-54-dependent Fis family transcriptional regulator [Deltaproteobacteria bacterium]|nr:MAG: sigma-54-dependent Fis family transcriptional regulator [Deltaproteobacteria bacterium]